MELSVCSRSLCVDCKVFFGASRASKFGLFGPLSVSIVYVVHIHTGQDAVAERIKQMIKLLKSGEGK